MKERPMGHWLAILMVQQPVRSQNKVLQVTGVDQGKFKHEVQREKMQCCIYSLWCWLYVSGNYRLPYAVVALAEQWCWGQFGGLKKEAGKDLKRGAFVGFSGDYFENLSSSL